MRRMSRHAAPGLAGLPKTRPSASTNLRPKGAGARALQVGGGPNEAERTRMSVQTGVQHLGHAQGNHDRRRRGPRRRAAAGADPGPRRPRRPPRPPKRPRRADARQRPRPEHLGPRRAARPARAEPRARAGAGAAELKVRGGVQASLWAPAPPLRARPCGLGRSATPAAPGPPVGRARARCRGRSSGPGAHSGRAVRPRPCSPRPGPAPPELRPHRRSPP